MGNGCCKQELENNPDGSPKDPQTKEQAKDDPADLRRWAKDGDSVELERLLKRMPVKAIQSGSKKSEGQPEEEDHTALHFAAARGALPCVELLVLYGSGVNQRGGGGATPLHSALDAGRRDVASFLLEHAGDINAKDKQGASPFLTVMLSGRKRLTTWLLDKCGASLDVSTTDKSGVGPCTVAARYGWWDLLEKLTGLAGDPATALNTRSSAGETPLGWVLKYGASGLLPEDQLVRLVSLLLGKGASAVVPAFHEQIPPVCLAAATGNADVLSALREKGAVLDPAVSSDSVRRNVLHYAAAKGHLQIVQFLIREEGLTQLNVGDAAGNTPVHLAAVRGHDEVARALLENAPDVATAIMATNLEGVSTYHLMLQAGPGDQAQRGVLWILDRIGEEGSKAVIKIKEIVLETPLLMAVGSHQELVVAKLLELGHDANEANFTGETPMSRCLSGATVSTAVADGAIFRSLLDKGAKLENASGASHPLLAICMSPLSKFAEQVVKVLVAQAGGDATALKWADHADAGGRGPLHLAALYDNAYMVKYLLDTVKLEVDARCGSGLSPLMYAAMGSATNAIRVLLNRRADVRATDPTGASVLSYCLKLDRLESLACAAMLLVMGCPPDDSSDLRGEGLVHRAVRYGASEFIRLWARYGGNLCQLATTEETANDLPEEVRQLQLAQPQAPAAGGEAGAAAAAAAVSAAAAAAAAERRRKRAEGDYMDAAPQPLEAEEEDAEEGGEDVGSGKFDEAPQDGTADGERNMSAGSGADAGYGGKPRTGSGRSVGSGAGSRTVSGRMSSGRAGSGRAGSVGDGGGFIKLEPEALPTSGGDGGGEDAYGMETVSEGGIARYDTGDAAAAEAEAELESFSVPTGPAYGRGVAEAIEAVEMEVSRFPSFCRMPSVLEVRRWARRGAAWFDDALPTVSSPDLGADGCPPSLPLPPDEEEEIAEEEAAAADAAPHVHPALDANAIWRRMLLEKMKDRRPRPAPPASGCPQQRTSACGVAESAMCYTDGGAGGANGDIRGLPPRAPSSHSSASGVASSATGGGGASRSAGSSSFWRRSGSGNGSMVERPGSSSSGRHRSSSSHRSSGGDGGAYDGPAPSAAAAAPTATIGEDWMDEIIRSAEETLRELQRGEVAAAASGLEGAYGSGSRAVRAVARSRRSLSPGEVSSPRPVAESRENDEGGGSSGSDSSGSDSGDDSDAGEGEEGEDLKTLDGKLESALDDAKDFGMGLASKLMDKTIAINDPYYQKGKRYKGKPRYMDDDVVNVKPASRDELEALAAQVTQRVKRYAAPVDEPPLTGGALRERNIKWYNQSLSPSEYPMKLGQWKAATKKAKAAALAAKARKPGEKVVVRSRKAWFGLPAMPSRPELKGTSALVYAVRLCRPACVAALLDCSLQPLNLPDGWGHSPVAYAAYMLACDKHNAVLQQLYDMILAKLPQVNFTRLDPKDGNAGHSLLCPINLAVVTGDSPRLAYLVLKCAGAINDSWTALPDIPIYLRGAWEKMAGRTDCRCPPIVLAAMSKRIDAVKLVLDLGANPNVFGEARDLKLKAKRLKEFNEDLELQRQLQSDYGGVLTKTKLGMMQKLNRLKRFISNIEIPGITKPDPFLTALHVAARTGQAEVAFLLLRRGAMANGGGAVPYAKRSPLQEALMYARSNFRTTNPAAKRKNWKEVRPYFEDLPPMSPEAVKKEANAKAGAMMRALVDPTMMALKAVALAAKYAVNFLLEMRKRPIAHWDPAIWTAHVLLLYRAPYDLSEPQTVIVLRDLMDNGKWKWMRRPAAKKFKVKDSQWTDNARSQIDELKKDLDIGYPRIGTTPEPKEYKALKQQFVSRADQAYLGAGNNALYQRYQKCSKAHLEVQTKYVLEQLQPAIETLAAQSVRLHVQGTAELLGQRVAWRQEVLEQSAESLERGTAVDEEGLMDGRPYARFALPSAVLPGDVGATVDTAAQAAAVERLRAQAARAEKEESWGRVAVWGGGGIFKGVPGDEGLQTLPTGEDELKALSKELSGVDTDKLKESLANLQDQLEVAGDTLLAKMQDAQEGLSNLLDIIGIDFLDIL